MALPVRPSSASRNFPPNHLQSTPASELSDLSGLPSQKSIHAVPTTSNSNSTAMGAPLPDSTAPFSDPPSQPLPGTWPSAKAPGKTAAKEIDATKKGVAPPLKAYETPAPPVSAKPTTPSLSKKRTHPDQDDTATVPPAPKPSTKRAKPNAPGPPRPNTRPARTRKAPQRYTDTQPRPPPKKPAPPRKPASKVFDPVYVTTNSNSRLRKADIYHMLLLDAPWTILTAAQKQELLGMLPPSPENRRLLQRIETGEAAATERPVEFSKNFNLFRTDVAKFLEDLGNGHLAKGWLASAQQAVLERATGRYDDWKEEEAELWWGQK